jgi:hypothetical protein
MWLTGAGLLVAASVIAAARVSFANYFFDSCLPTSRASTTTRPTVVGCDDKAMAISLTPYSSLSVQNRSMPTSHSLALSKVLWPTPRQATRPHGAQEQGNGQTRMPKPVKLCLK